MVVTHEIGEVCSPNADRVWPDYYFISTMPVEPCRTRRFTANRKRAVSPKFIVSRTIQTFTDPSRYRDADGTSD
jgi:hypothetical protein